MPNNLQIVGSDGKVHETPLPEGFQPTPENVAEVMKQANMPLVDATPHDQAQEAQGVTTTTTTTGPGAFSRVGSAALRAIEDRTTTPLQALINPQSTLGERAGGAMTLGGMVMARHSPLMLLAGPVVQAAAGALTNDPGIQRTAGTTADLGAGLFQIGRAVMGATGRAKALVTGARSELEAAGAPGMHSTEVAGQAVQGGLQTQFSGLHDTLGKEFDRLEGQIVKTTPLIQPNGPGYAEAQQILNYVDAAEASAGGRADGIVKEIRDAIHPPGGGDQQPIAMKKLVALRKILNERARVTNPLDPDASVVGRKAAELRQITMDTINAGADQTQAGQYAELRGAWRTQVTEPEGFLTGITSDKVSPAQAFTALFAGQDPHKIRVAAEVMRGNPAVLGKLRMGFGEAMYDAVTKGDGADSALKRLDLFTPTLQKAGLYSANELADMKFLLQRNAMSNLMQQLTGQARTYQVMLRGVLGANLATHVSSSPYALIAGAMAFGGLPLLRKAAMLPAGSQAQTQMLGAIMRNTGLGMRSMFQAGGPTSAGPQAAGGANVQQAPQ